MADPITNWIDTRIQLAITQLRAQLHDEIVTDLAAMENSLTAQITSIPGLLVGQITNVLNPTQLAQQIITGVTGVVVTLPQQIITGVLTGVENILNPFKEQP